MKINIKKMICVALVFIMMGQLFAVAFAVDPETPATDPEIEEFVNISRYSCNCYISGITLYASASLTANSSMSLQITIELQRLDDGTYETIKTWTDSKTGVSLGMNEDKLINVFSTYRIKVTFTAGGESTTAYSYA